MACNTTTMGALNLEAFASTKPYYPRRTLILKHSVLSNAVHHANCNRLSHSHSRKGSADRSCLPRSPSGDTRAEEGVVEAAEAGNDKNEGKPRLSSQSSWEAKDVLGNDYLYRLGKEADNMNITVGAKGGMIDSLFAGNFLGQEGEYILLLSARQPPLQP